MQPFTLFDNPLFRQIWHDIPGLFCKYGSSSTFSRRVDEEFVKARALLKKELGEIGNCSTISLSLDGWKSQNGHKIFAIIGHWITADFQPRHRLLDFQEVEGPDTGENLASIVYTVLSELDIGAKLLSITGDNASNNPAMVEILFGMLKADFDTEIFPLGNARPVMRYQGEASFVRCLAHILNLIVKEFLGTLRASNAAADSRIVEDLQKHLSLEELPSAFSRIRILALYVSASSERKKEWRDICQLKGMDSRLIQYDVDTRWNSAYRMLDDAWKV
jgi:hypothetical protein